MRAGFNSKFLVRVIVRVKYAREISAGPDLPKKGRAGRALEARTACTAVTDSTAQSSHGYFLWTRRPRPTASSRSSDTRVVGPGVPVGVGPAAESGSPSLDGLDLVARSHACVHAACMPRLPSLHAAVRRVGSWACRGCGGEGALFFGDIDSKRETFRKSANANI